MTPAAIDVVYEDNHLLVLNKPPLLPTAGAALHDDSLVTRCRHYLKTKYHKPGNVYVGVVSRLDRVVSGLVVMARTSKAAGRLTDQFRDRQVDKIYWAMIGADTHPPAQGVLEDWLVHDDAAHRVRVVSGASASPGAKLARLSFTTLRRVAQGYLLQIHLHTGRKHQIRVQLSHAGLPIAGDRKYGSRQRFAVGIALHSQSLTFVHPVRLNRLTFEIPPPEHWQLAERNLR